MSFNVIQAINNLSALFSGLTTGQNKIESIDNLATALASFAPSGGISANRYLPVGSNPVNIGGGALFQPSHYMQVGKEVIVNILAAVTPAGAGACSFNVTLPIPSTFIAINDVVGSCTINSPTSAVGGVVTADLGTGLPIVLFTGVGAVGSLMSANFIYQILP